MIIFIPGLEIPHHLYFFFYLKLKNKNKTLFLFGSGEELAAALVKYPKFSPFLLRAINLLSIPLKDALVFLILEFKIMAPKPYSFDSLSPKRNSVFKNGCWHYLQSYLYSVVLEPSKTNSLPVLLLLTSVDRTCINIRR